MLWVGQPAASLQTRPITNIPHLKPVNVSSTEGGPEHPAAGHPSALLMEAVMSMPVSHLPNAWPLPIPLFTG